MKSNPIIYLILGAVILGGLFFLFKPKPQVSVTQETTSTSSPQSNVFELVIKEQKVTSGPNIIKVNQGEEITIKVTSDEEEEFHIHGYDEFVDLKPNQLTELKFTTNLSGRFVFELEYSKTEIGALEVQPKQQ